MKTDPATPATPSASGTGVPSSLLATSERADPKAPNTVQRRKHGTSVHQTKRLQHMTICCTLIAGNRALTVAPEVRPSRVARVTELVSSALGDDGGGAASPSSRDRYASVRRSISGFQTDLPANELVYGELSVPVLATILDAVGVRTGDVFLDIGSGDGGLVLAASLLYAPSPEDEGGTAREENSIAKAYGVEIVPGLVERSNVHWSNLRRVLDQSSLGRHSANVEFALGDVHEPNEDIRRILAEATVAVCFATTWSAGNADLESNKGRTSLQGRRLPRLSKALVALRRDAASLSLTGG
ncbi:hypothetical protein THAOC_20164 [Thalassiosira oceanica]|uniref:DOT1 domain-containing protein n=1 Tax=Thalassiosira oceanica TaxID=159749 RepID=K0S0J2_THAOC|nr:hypothetical protein THAOC_20164 [Thalassiosira oceanica]|eukprot:EJK59588.1 hypothetical protein THAOC_20164 [Thalassiosira oceanica]